MGDGLVTLKSYPDTMTAELDRARLEASGIRTVVMDGTTAQVDWQLTNALGGVKLRVAAAEAAAAEELLGVQPEADEPTALSPKSQLAERAANIALFGFFFAPIQIYASLLIIECLLMTGTIHPLVRRKFILGVVANAVVMGAMLALVVFLVFFRR